MNDDTPLPRLLRGDADASVLQNCRFEGAGTLAYGREAIADLFAEGRVAGTDAPLIADGGGRHAAAFTGTTALVADLYDGWIARVWLCATDAIGEPRPASVDVPFDLDLDQRGGSIAFDPADHPGIDAEDADGVRRFAATFLAARHGGLTRSRPFVLRAFPSPIGVAVLVAVQGIGANARPVRYNVAALLPRDGSAAVVIRDLAGLADAVRRPWAPQL